MRMKNRLRHKAIGLVRPFEHRMEMLIHRSLASRFAHANSEHQSLTEALQRTETALGGLRVQLDKSTGHAEIQAQLDSLKNVLQLIYDEEPTNRRRLWQLRETPDYELAFSEAEPLVSIVIPTYNNYPALGERALPSALAQTYANLEVVVVGDSAPEETANVIDELNDGRIRYRNLERRGPYSDDPQKLWLVGGTPPYNTAVRMSRGRWIAYLSDDDSFRADHIEQLVQKAKAERLEMCYGLLVQHNRDGSQVEIGDFPPSLGHFGFQAAIYHAGLAEFLEFELADAEFGQPVDWGLCRRMLRAGIRVGMVRRPTADYFPSWDWGGRKERHMTDGGS